MFYALYNAETTFQELNGMNNQTVSFFLAKLLTQLGSALCIAAIATSAQAYDALNGILDRTETIGGIDVNHDGVRDDIEAFIKQRYTESKERAAMLQYARSTQDSVLVDKTDRAAAKAVMAKASRAIKCVFAIFNPEKNPNNALPHLVTNEIDSLTTNTKARLKAYLAFSRALDGSVITQPQGNTCD